MATREGMINLLEDLKVASISEGQFFLRHQVLKTLKSAVTAKKSAIRRNIQFLLQVRDGGDIQSQKSKVYRAKDDFVAQSDVERACSFKLTQSLPEQFGRVNEGTRVVLDVDTKHRFFWAFVSLGAAVACLSDLAFDGL